MYKVVIAGSRHRGWQDGVPHNLQEGSVADLELVSQLLNQLCAVHGDQLLVLSVGCDTGFGRMVRTRCEQMGLPFAEVGMRISEKVPREQYVLLWLARHAALVDLGQEYHIFVVDSRFSHIEDLVTRAEQSGLPCTIYTEATACLGGAA